MPADGPLTRLTILVDATEQWHGTPLYTTILRRARRDGLAATAGCGGEGFPGPCGHATDRPTADGCQPVVVTVVDDRCRVEEFLDSLDDVMDTAVALVDDVDDGGDRSAPRNAAGGPGARRTARAATLAERWRMSTPKVIPPTISGLVRRPRCAADLPHGAWDALTGAVGPLDLRHIAVTPAGVRRDSSDRRAEAVANQVMVLGFGVAAVGLWTLGRVWRVVPYRDLVVVRDEQVLLYGRLSLVATGTRLTIRYNTVFRGVVEPLVRTVRRRAFVLGTPLPALPEPVGLPYKWQRLVSGPISRLDPGERAGVLTGRRRGRRTSRTAAAMVVSARELVVMVEPDRLRQHYGVDAFYLPRAGLQQATRAGPLLRLRVHDTPVELDVGDELALAASHYLAAVAPAPISAA